MGEIRLTIPGELTDLNTYINAERSNRYKAAKLKKYDTDLVTMLCMSQLRGQTITRPVDITITWYTKNKKKDPDNVAFAKKFILDGIVKAKVLPQDSRKWIYSFCDRFEVDSKNPRVEVVLVEM